MCVVAERDLDGERLTSIPTGDSVRQCVGCVNTTTPSGDVNNRSVRLCIVSTQAGQLRSVVSDFGA